MNTETEEQPKDAPKLAWKVAKVPANEKTLKVGGVRAGIDGVVRLTKEDADAINSALPGALEFQGA